MYMVVVVGGGGGGGGRLLLYVRDDIPCKEVKSHTLPINVECMRIEIKLRKKTPLANMSTESRRHLTSTMRNLVTDL